MVGLVSDRPSLLSSGGDDDVTDDPSTTGRRGGGDGVGVGRLASSVGGGGAGLDAASAYACDERDAYPSIDGRGVTSDAKATCACTCVCRSDMDDTVVVP